MEKEGGRTKEENKEDMSKFARHLDGLRPHRSPDKQEQGRTSDPPFSSARARRMNDELVRPLIERRRRLKSRNVRSVRELRHTEAPDHAVTV